MKKLDFNEEDVKQLIHIDSRADRFWRVFWRTIRQIIYVALLFAILFVTFNFPAYFKRFKYSIQATPAAKVTLTPTDAAAPAPNYPPSISIPKIGVNAPIILNVAPADMLTELKNGVTQYEGTALPGQIGNVVLVGHSSDYVWSDGHYKTVFALLDQLKDGDQILIPYQSQQYVYQVTSSQVVKATDLSVLDKTTTPSLTLVTCYPVGTSLNRLIITANLVNGTPSGEQTTTPAAASLPSAR